MGLRGTLSRIKRIGATGQHDRRKGTPWYHWFSKQDTPAERKLLLKLDLLIIPYAFVAYWVKFVDQANVNNAYVSGMREDLNFRGNELVSIQAMYTAGVAIGGIPLIYLLPRFPVNWIIPALEFGWGVFTLLQYRTASYAEIRAYRFFVGVFEAGFFPGVNYVLGSWYRGDELGRRGGMFYTGQMLGNLTAGLLQSAASAHLDGVNGLAGWRWAFILDAIITFPVAIIGFAIWPGTPAKPNRWVLSEQDIIFARKRLEAARNDVDEEATIKSRTALQFLREYLWDWKCWVLTMWYTLYCNTASLQYGGYLLWLKSLNRYSVPRVNELGTTSPAIGILLVLIANFTSDLALGPLMTLTLALTWNLVCMIILAIWHVPEAALWFAFNTLYVQVSSAALFYGWLNEILRRDSLGRSATLMISYMIAQSSTAGTSVAVFPTSEGPRFLKGWTFAGALSVVFIVYTWAVVLPLSIRDEKKYAQDDRDGSVESVERVSEGFEATAKDKGTEA